MKKEAIFSALGAVGSFIAWLFGGWDASIITLLIFMAIDYISGMIVAGIFHKSKKSQTGGLESRAGLKGLLRKGMMLAIVIVANFLELQTGYTFLRDFVCIAFIINEAVSILENAGLMGLPIPTILTKAIDALGNKNEEKSAAAFETSDEESEAEAK